MKLQIEAIEIKDVKAGSSTRVSDHILHIDLQELEKIILQDSRIKSVEINIVHPGDRVRIVNVVDIIQPRCKIDRENEDFPGWLGKLAIVGKGRTRSLQGVSVVLSNRFSKRPYSSVLDMFGVGAELSKYGNMRNLCIDPTPSANTDERDFESSVKLAGLKAAVYLARAGAGHSIDKTEIYELNIPDSEKSHLPRVAYYYQLYSPQHDYQGISDPILYGTAVNNMLPTLIHPNEILDGGVVNGQTIRGMETYSIQTHAVIKELFKRHKKELIFAGVVIGVASLEPVQRQRMSLIAANLVCNVLGAQGVVLTKVAGGMPHADLGLVGEACENLGVKTTLFAQLTHSGNSLAESALFSSDSLDAIVNIGQALERICLPRADRILGGTPETQIFNPDFVQRAVDEIVDVEGFLYPGLYDFLGGAKIIAVDY